MPGGISLFLLWAAPSVAMLLGAIIGVVFYKQGVKRAGRTAFNGFRRVFFKESYKKYLRNQMMQYDRELSAGKFLGKRFQRGYVPRRPNIAQRGLQRAHIRRYEPRDLKPREQEWRRKKMHHIKNYLEKHDRTSDTAYLDHSVRTLNESRDSVEKGFINQYLSTKEYIKTPRHSVMSKDHSIITTSSKEIRENFLNIANKKEFSESATKNHDDSLQHALYISTRDSKSVPLESFNAKNSEVYYTISRDILKHISNNVPEEIYPVRITQTIVKDGKAVKKEDLYTRKEVRDLIKFYETKLENDKTAGKEPSM